MKNEDKTWDFDSWADKYDDIVAATNSPLYARYEEVLDTVVRIAGISQGKCVLDIGTGTGNLALRCLTRGASVVGLDPSEAMLARANSKVNSGTIIFLRVDEPFSHIPFPDLSFDAVLSTYAFHHVPHHRKPDGVREMARVLRHGGSLVLGDLIFEDEQAERRALVEYDWLEEEYFARIECLRPVFADLGMELNARQITPVTWILWASRISDISETRPY